MMVEAIAVDLVTADLETKNWVLGCGAVDPVAS